MNKSNTANLEFRSQCRIFRGWTLASGNFEKQYLYFLRLAQTILIYFCIVQGQSKKTNAHAELDFQ